MNWLRENPFMAGLAALTVVAAGALVFLLTGSLGQYQELSDSYSQAVQKLHNLQNRSPFPKNENLEKTKALQEQYKAELGRLRTDLAKLVVPINPDVKPQQFQDDLRAAVNQTLEKAKAANVTLPNDFYLGFGPYRDSLPSERAAPALARQLVVINQIVAHLIDFKVQSIDLLDRAPLPEETTANPPKTRPLVERFPFDIAFTSEQSRFRVTLNSLLGTDQFFIVRSLTVENSNPVGPPLAQPDTASAPPTMPAVGGEEKPANLNVVFGRETIKVTLRAEMIDFPENK